ncbi:MAG TPA: hypothetical protein VNL17_14570 [Verrucomicrobiae bacterium]|nr:hypothetical protein [Verrucomicrobiae bacterium]
MKTTDRKLVMWEDAKRKVREADKTKLLPVSVNSKVHTYALEMGWLTHHIDGQVDWMIHRSQEPQCKVQP